MKKSYFLFLLFCLSCSLLLAQPVATTPLALPKVPPMRLLNHDYIDNNQRLIAKLDGKDDSLFTISLYNDSLNFVANDALTIFVDNIQAKIELNSEIGENNKYKWLRGLNDALLAFISGYKAKLYKGELFIDLMYGFDASMELDWNGKSYLRIVEKYNFEIGEMLTQNYALKNNEAATTSSDILLLKKIYRYPKRTMALLAKNPQAFFVDSILASFAYKEPEQLYNFAAAPDALGKRIVACQEPLVKTIGLLAIMKTGRMYFPFLDNLYKGKITLDSITNCLNDTTAYFKLLVNTQIEYAERVRNADTPLVMTTLTAKLKKKAIEFYVTEINRLHDEKLESVRYKCLAKLTPQDLYYVAVLGEEEIYTSSFVSGVYPRMFQRMKVASSDTLLQLVKYDKFKKFIKIAANYNTLDDFLKKMDTSNAEKLMRSFVSGLETTKSLEDAVDVANSYASIYNPKLKNLILEQIEANLQTSILNQNKRGQTIYDLLNTIFSSLDTSKHIDVAVTLGINGIYEMPITNLVDTGGRIIIQQFFYGDKDGKGAFNNFFQNYPPTIWKKTVKENWVELTSKVGVPITIYSNKPLDNETDLDAGAQKALGMYLEENNLPPTVVIHRGHSYFVGSTIDQLPSSAKVILLGSCGGYQRLSDVLDICEGAHIISSKQTGTGNINIAIINSITANLRANKNLNWPAMWSGIEKTIKPDSKEKFDDYVPPHKNLGAIFIMAYNMASGT